MAEKIYPKVEKGMLVKLKYDIRESLGRHGSNRCKVKFAGQIRKVVNIGIQGKMIELERTPEEIRAFRSSRNTWKFWVGDVECIVDFNGIKDVKKEEFVFDPEQLVTC